MFDIGEQYFKGVLAGYLGANFMSGPITEWQIDVIKENISHYCEATIDHSLLSYQEKEDQKRQMKQNLECEKGLRSREYKRNRTIVKALIKWFIQETPYIIIR